MQMWHIVLLTMDLMHLPHNYKRHHGLRMAAPGEGRSGVFSGIWFNAWQNPVHLACGVVRTNLGHP